MEKSLAVLIPIIFCICVSLCVYFVSRFRYKTISKLGGPIPRNPNVRGQWKKIGIVVIGFALGLLTVGLMFYHGIIHQSKWNGVFIISVVSLFVGVSMILADKLDVNNKSVDG